MQAAHRVAKNTGILYVQMALTMILSLYITRLLLIELGKEDFGIFNLIAGAIGMLTFLNSAMTVSSQRFMSFAYGEGNIDKQKKVFNTSLILHFFIAIVIVLMLEILGHYMFGHLLKIAPNRMDVAENIYQFLIINTFFAVISVPYDAVINANENMLFVAILKIIETIMMLASALYITYQQLDKLFVYGQLITLVAVLLFFIRLIYCHFNYEAVVIDVRRYRDKTIFKEMYAHAGWSLLGSSSSMISMQGITIILNSFFGVIVNAAQGISNQISGQLMAFSNTMLKSLNPVIVKSEGSSNRNQMLKASIIGNKLSFFLLSFFAIPMLIEMPFVLTVWLKNVPEYTVIFCRLTVLRLMLSQLTVTFPIAIGATNNIKQSQIFESCIYLFLLPISYFVFKLGFSPEFIYINLIIMVLFLFISRIYFTHKICGLLIKEYFQDVVGRCFLVLIVTFSISIIPIFLIDEGFIRLIIVILSSVFVFFMMIISIGLNKTEKKMIRSVYENMIFKFLKK